jgi:chemotaxis protein CheZ
MFFSEEKNQKTFKSAPAHTSGTWPDSGAPPSHPSTGARLQKTTAFPAYPAAMHPDHHALRTAIREELHPLFDDLRRFVDRRIAELSVEVHGATQLLGFSEDNLSAQLGRLHEQVGRMLSAPSEATRNSGMELEAVVQTTEAAANQIMEAAEAINDCVRQSMPDQVAMRASSARIDAIFEACAFQDLTGQRLRRAIEHLQHMESTLTGILAPGTDHAVFHPAPPTVASTGADVSQHDIDALFD